MVCTADRILACLPNFKVIDKWEFVPTSGYSNLVLDLAARNPIRCNIAVGYNSLVCNAGFHSKTINCIGKSPSGEITIREFNSFFIGQETYQKIADMIIDVCKRLDDAVKDFAVEYDVLKWISPNSNYTIEFSSKGDKIIGVCIADEDDMYCYGFTGESIELCTKDSPVIMLDINNPELPAKLKTAILDSTNTSRRFRG